MMRVTSKGQVTIPQQIREKLGLLPHSEVQFDIVGNSVRIRKAGKQGKRMTRGEMIVARLRGTGNKRYRTDEIMALLRGED
jgi:AbrB family looped-hinge helix DNA binding protein